MTKPSPPRRAIAVTVVMLGWAASSGAQPSQGPNALISTSNGTVGVYQIGKTIVLYGRVVRPSDCRVPGGASDERCYSSPDGNFFLGVDPGGVVRAVRTTSPEIFTDRFVRPVFSKMEEVVSRYGVPEKVERLASGVSFVYGPLSFQVDAAGTAQDIMPKPVAAITLRLAEAAVPIVRRRLSDPNPMKLPADFCQNVAQLVDSAWEGFDSIRVDPGQRVSADGRKWNVTLDLTGRGNSSLQYETRDLYSVRGANEWDWTSNVPKFVATFDAGREPQAGEQLWRLVATMTEQCVPPGSVWKDYRDPHLLEIRYKKRALQGQNVVIVVAMDSASKTWFMIRGASSKRRW